MAMTSDGRTIPDKPPPATAPSCWGCLSEISSDDTVCPFCQSYQRGLMRYLTRVVATVLAVLLAASIVQMYLRVSTQHAEQAQTLTARLEETKATLPYLAQRVDAVAIAEDGVRQENRVGQRTTLDLANAIRETAQALESSLATCETSQLYERQIAESDQPLIPLLADIARTAIADVMLGRPSSLRDLRIDTEQARLRTETSVAQKMPLPPIVKPEKPSPRSTVSPAPL